MEDKNNPVGKEVLKQVDMNTVVDRLKSVCKEQPEAMFMKADLIPSVEEVKEYAKKEGFDIVTDDETTLVVGKKF